jgi:hypothetical protein
MAMARILIEMTRGGGLYQQRSRSCEADQGLTAYQQPSQSNQDAADASSDAGDAEVNLDEVEIETCGIADV